MPEPRSAPRAYAALRTALIGYGIAAYALLHPGSGQPPGSPPDAGGAATGSYLFWGLTVQAAVIVVHALIRRRVTDPAKAAQGMLVVELLADGATVLLFALATLGAIGGRIDRF